MHPFLDVRVIPTYGNFTARIIWKVIPSFEHGVFFILKSPNGITNFRQIGVVNDKKSFEDRELLPDGKFTETYYKVVTKDGDKQYESDPVGTFGQITREEFCTARYVLGLESEVMKKFTRILAFQIASEKPCPVCTDPDTNQKIGISRCHACYGTGHEGGYLPGMWTYMRLMEESPQVKMDSADGAGTSEPTNYKARLLAFPSLSKDDLLVDPGADMRYLVDLTETSMFKGKIPIVMIAQLQLLRRNDIRYTIPVDVEACG
jgi:hypothetical protein